MSLFRTSEFRSLPGQFYGLPDYPMDEYRQLLISGVDESDLNLYLTGSSDPLPLAWTHIKKKDLTRNAKLFYYFVAARLMPTVVNSEVQRSRAILTYAILRGLTVDVGRVINSDMRVDIDPRGRQYSFGFPALIHGLTRAAGY